MTAQLFQVAGALAILVPFGWSQLGSLDPASLRYLVLNFSGSALLAALAGASDQWGFLVLEGCWAAVSALNLMRMLRRRLSRPESVVGATAARQGL